MTNKLKNLYYRVLTTVFYRAGMRGCGSHVLILRPLLITFKYLQVGNKVFIRDSARIEGVSRYMAGTYNPLINIGNHVSIEQNLHLTCAGKITIGDNTAIAANVSITDIHHPYTDINTSPEQQPIEVFEVSIGPDCKLYNNVVILPGAHLGKHTTVGANSVVRSGSYPDYCVLAGIPAKIIKVYSVTDGCWMDGKNI